MAGRPVLLVHGAWHGPWCWSDWVAELERHGTSPYAMELPGHDRPGSRTRIWHGLRSYVSAVEGELDRLGPDTVVIAHSMGGLVAQRALETRSAAMAVLLASVPTTGVAGASIRTARDIPMAFAKTNATLSMYPIIETPALTRRAFFTPHAPAAAVGRCHRALQNESYRAYLQMFWTLPRPHRVESDVRVIAAAEDRIFSVSEQRRLASRYGVDAVVIDGCGHDVMLDPAGTEAIERIIDWIDGLG